MLREYFKVCSRSFYSKDPLPALRTFAIGRQKIYHKRHTGIFVSLRRKKDKTL